MVVEGVSGVQVVHQGAGSVQRAQDHLNAYRHTHTHTQLPVHLDFLLTFVKPGLQSRTSLMSLIFNGFICKGHTGPVPP